MSEVPPVPRRNRRGFAATKARRGIVIAVIAFFLLQLGTGWVLEDRAVEVVDPEYAMREQRLRARIAEQPGKPVVVVFGSSRVANGFEAAVTTQLLQERAIVFNFGIPTSGPLLQRVFFDRLLAAGIQPDLVLFEVMPPFFHDRSIPLDHAMLEGSRLTRHEITFVSPKAAAVGGPLRKYAYGRLLPSVCYAADAQERLGLRVKDEEGDLAVDPYGWTPVILPPGTRRDDLVGLAHRQYDTCYRSFQLAPTQVQRMDDLIRSAQEKQIRVGLIVMPEGSEFRLIYSPAMQNDLRMALERWQREFSVSVIDGRDWLGDEWFYDMHHLIQLGATTFADRVVKSHLRNWVTDLSRAKDRKTAAR